MGVLNATSDSCSPADTAADMGLRRLPGMVQPVQHAAGRAIVTDCIEMWDYVGGIRFRGFVADKDGEKALFVFFDQGVVNADLKAGLMALLELCEVPYFGCARLVVCVDRQASAAARDSLAKDLGWIGFGLTTLDDFVPDDDMEAEVTSQKWLFMEMET